MLFFILYSILMCQKKKDGEDILLFYSTSGYNNIIKPIYNNVVKPFVEPIYNKVIKPAGNWMLDNYNKAKYWFKR